MVRRRLRASGWFAGGPAASAGAFDVLGDEVLQSFLVAAGAGWLLVAVELCVMQLLQRDLAVEDPLFLGPAGVAVGDTTIELAVVDDCGGHEQ